MASQNNREIHLDNEPIKTQSKFMYMRQSARKYERTRYDRFWSLSQSWSVAKQNQLLFESHVKTALWRLWHDCRHFSSDFDEKCLQTKRCIPYGVHTIATMRKWSAITLITQKPLYSDLCNLVAVLYMETSYRGFHLKRMYQQYGSKAKQIMSFANNIAILVVANETA